MNKTPQGRNLRKWWAESNSSKKSIIRNWEWVQASLKIIQSCHLHNETINTYRALVPQSTHHESRDNQGASERIGAKRWKMCLSTSCSTSTILPGKKWDHYKAFHKDHITKRQTNKKKSPNVPSEVDKIVTRRRGWIVTL